MYTIYKNYKTIAYFVKIDFGYYLIKIIYMNKKLLNEKEIIESIQLLERAYPDAGCELKYDSVFHLLIAVCLSAQTTDASVNKISPALFERYKDPESLAKADIAEVEGIIKAIGLYKNKSRNIIALSKMLVEDFNGEVPNNYDDLIKLPGVGRKTANVVMAEAFGEQRIAVDTHVFRLANRIGFCDEPTPEKTESALKKCIPHDMWTRAHHLLIFHGRRCCTARKPKCGECPIARICGHN